MKPLFSCAHRPRRILLPLAGLLGLLLLCAPLLPALDNNKTLTQYTHRVWTQEEGLLDPTVYSLLQTRDGLLWLGTQDGLVRFDGERFRPLRLTHSSESGPLVVRGLAEDNNGNLWAATIGNGVLKLSRRTHTWYNSANGLPSYIATCVANARDGAVWICTNQGLVRMRGNTRTLYNTASGLPGNHVSSTCTASDGTQWAGTFDHGLSRLIGNRFEPFVSRDAGLNANVRTIACDPDGSLWAGADHGLFHIQGAAIAHFGSGNGLPDDSVLTLHISPDGSLWVGTQSGVSRFWHGEWSRFRTRDGLSHSTVLSLATDREGSLWAGTKNGLDQFTDSRVTPYTISEGLPSNDTGPVIEDKLATLWIGTSDRGLARFDGRHFQRVTTRQGLLDNAIRSLALDAAGDLWVGTDGGLNRLHNGVVDGRFTTRNGLPADTVTALFVDTENRLWAGTEKGLVIFSSGRFEPPPQFGPLAHEPVIALGGGRITRLLASTAAGRLLCLRNNKVVTYSLPDPIRPISSYYPDAKSRSLWIGTLGTGLLRINSGDPKRVRVRDGLFDEQIYAIVPDDHENLWFASGKGIFRVSERELDDFADGKRRSINSIPFSTGQLRFECQPGVNPGAWRTHDGRLWFATTNGVVAVDPNHLHPNTLPPPAQIETVFVNGQRHEPDSALDLAPYEKNLEIRYAGLSFVTPEKVTFRYILEGYDKHWVEAGSRREAFYTNLPPGNFRFRVIACNSDGVWSSRGAELNFTIEPLLYQRAWFFPLLGALVGLCIWLWYQMRIRRLRNEFDLVISERTRIARELHDTLLQGLSGITMQLQALWTRLPVSNEKNLLQEIIRDAGKCLTDARHSLWGLRTRPSAPNGFSENLARHLRDAVSGHPVKLNLNVAPLSFGLAPDTEYQLLRIAQEAVANAVRHGEPKTIDVRLVGKKRKLIELSIKDDGRGFSADIQHAQFGHYGLVGMRERAEEIGAKLAISSMRGLGTEVLVTIRAASDPSDARRFDSEQPVTRNNV